MKEVFKSFVKDNLPCDKKRIRYEILTLIYPDMIYPEILYTVTYEIPIAIDYNDMKNISSYK